MTLDLNTKHNINSTLERSENISDFRLLIIDSIAALVAARFALESVELVEKALFEFLKKSLQLSQKELSVESSYNLNLGIQFYNKLLRHWLRTNQLTKIFSLVPPQINPEHESLSVNGQEIMAIDHFTSLHYHRDLAWAAENAEKLAENAEAIAFFGSMFSSKTGGMQETFYVFKDLVAEKGLQLNYQAFIGEGLNRTQIAGRSKKHLQPIDAEVVDFDRLMVGLQTYTENLTSDESTLNALLIDEITFIPRNEAEEDELIDMLVALQEKGVRLLIAGLDKTYRGETFRFIQKLTQRLQISIHDCYAYQMHKSNTGINIQEAFWTSRFMQSTQLWDVFYPVFYGDGHDSVSYFPGVVNPVQEMKEIDAEIYNAVVTMEDKALAEAFHACK